MFTCRTCTTVTGTGRICKRYCFSKQWLIGKNYRRPKCKTIPAKRPLGKRNIRQGSTWQHINRIKVKAFTGEACTHL